MIFSALPGPGRTWFRLRVYPCAAYALLLTLWAGTCFGRAEDTNTHSYVVSSDNKKVYDDDFAKLVKAKLDNAYQNLQIVVSSCYSGGFAAEAKSGANALNGNWSVNTARDKEHSHNNDATTAKKKWGEIGLKIGPWYYHGWRPQWIKKLKSDLNATSQALANYAKKHDHLLGGNPQFENGGTGAQSKVHDGVASNHAIIWSPDDDAEEFSKDLITELYTTLVAAGYANNTIDYAYDSKGGQVFNGKPVDRDATEANLGLMLTALRAALNAHPGQEKAFIFINAHGSTEKRKAEKKPNAVPNNPKQGKVITSGDGTQLELDETFVESFFVDVLVDDPYIEREGLPAVTLTTSEENYGGTVTVLLDGIEVGTFTMLDEPDGADYELELNDATLEELYNYGVLNDLVVDVTFVFDAGDFRIATEWDFDLADLDHYGVGLTAPAVSSNVRILETTGACCTLEGDCLEDVSEAYCESVAGSYRGDGTICAEEDCPYPPAEACCYPDGSCSDKVAEDCTASGGVPQGIGTICVGDGNGDWVDDACPTIPAVSDWGLAIMTLLLLAAGAIVFGGRRRSAESGGSR